MTTPSGTPTPSGPPTPGIARVRRAVARALPRRVVLRAALAGLAVGLGCWLFGVQGARPLLIGGCLAAVMLTWRKGVAILTAKTRRLETPIDTLIGSLEKHPPYFVPGTAVFLTSEPSTAPTALLHSLKHFKVLHENNVILTLVTEGIPRVPQQNRVQIEKIGERFTRVILRFGFMETPNVPRALAIARKLGWSFEIMSTSFFLSRRSVRPDVRSGMPLWQDRLFIFLAQNADDASAYFQLPADRVVEIGTQVTV